MKIRPAVLLALALLVAGCPVALSGCEGGGFGVEQTNLELNIEYGPYGQVWLKPALEKFQALYPDVKINIEYYTGANDDAGRDDYYSQLKTNLMAGKGPDIIFQIDAGEFGDLFKMMKAGAFADLNKFVESDPDFDISEYNPVVMQYGVFQNRRYLLPIHYLSAFYLTTQDILQESGFDISTAERDFSGLMHAFETYLDGGDCPIPLFSSYWSFRLPFNCAGIPLMNYDTETINQEAATEAKEAMRMYKKIRPFAPDGWELQGIDAFLRGASVLSWGSSIIDPKFLDLLNRLEERPVFLPIRDRQGRTTIDYANSVGINNASPNQKNAWNFIKIMLSQEIQKKYAIDMNSLPVRIDAQSVWFAPYEELKGKSATLDAAIEAFKKVSLYPESVTSDYMDGYAKIFDFMEDYFEGRTDNLDKSFDEALVKLEWYMSE